MDNLMKKEDWKERILCTIAWLSQCLLGLFLLCRRFLLSRLTRSDGHDLAKYSVHCLWSCYCVGQTPDSMLWLIRFRMTATYGLVLSHKHPVSSTMSRQIPCGHNFHKHHARYSHIHR